MYVEQARTKDQRFSAVTTINVLRTFSHPKICGTTTSLVVTCVDWFRNSFTRSPRESNDWCAVYSSKLKLIQKVVGDIHVFNHISSLDRKYASPRLDLAP